MNYLIKKVLPKLQSGFLPVMLIALILFPLIHWLGLEETGLVWLFAIYCSALFFGSLWAIIRQASQISDMYIKTALDNFMGSA